MDAEKNNLMWLDESFAKGLIDDVEAACCLSGVSQENVLVNEIHPRYLHWSDIKHPVVSKIFEIIHTWPNPTGKMPLLWYIEQAIIRDVPHVKYDLLFAKCTETEFRKKEIITNYHELAKKLELLNRKSELDNNMDENSGVSDETEQPKDRNDRLFQRAMELASNFADFNDIKLDDIHKQIYNEEKNKSKVSMVNLKHIVKLNALRKELKKMKSEKVN